MAKSLKFIFLISFLFWANFVFAQTNDNKDDITSCFSGTQLTQSKTECINGILTQVSQNASDKLFTTYQQNESALTAASGGSTIPLQPPLSTPTGPAPRTVTPPPAGVSPGGTTVTPTPPGGPGGGVGGPGAITPGEPITPYKFGG